MNPRNRWQRVSKSRPCPICEKPDYCLISPDGAIAGCMRVEPGSYRTKETKNGAPMYLHRLSGQAHISAGPTPANGAKTKRVAPEVLHQVYSALLAALPLSKLHRENLRERGLTVKTIKHNGYGSLPVRGRSRIAKLLQERFGDTLLSVPGFILKDKDGRRYLTIAGAAGLLVPVRDAAGNILALKVRRDDAGDCSHYSYVSSAGYAGPGPGSPVHVPVGIKEPAETVRLTEGELKADVAHYLSRVPTISAPGVTNWRPCLEVLKTLGAKTVRLALDMDARSKPTVAGPLLACAEALTGQGYAVELERWPLEAGKGIDDLLAARKSSEVLTGDAALTAVREIAEAAGVKAGELDVLGRLTDVLTAGGAGALFRDKDLLQALARVASDDPARYAGIKADIRGRVSLKELDKALKPFLSEQARARPPAIHNAGDYRVGGGCIVREFLTSTGPAQALLANFQARIAEQITYDDGAEKSILLALEGELPDGTRLSRAEVAADEFTRMDWVLPAWGNRPVVYAGMGTKDHLRATIQLLSGDVPARTTYTHLGWRKIGDRWHYLHASGAIGPDGPACEVAVSPPTSLSRFELPDPPAGADLADAVRASLRLLDLAPERITFPLFASVYRAVLGDCDFSLHLAGPTGNYKSELAALCQQHYGPAMARKELPCNWSSTGNSLEGIAFAAKDALVVIDDFAPSGSTSEVGRYHREAERVIRAQGNHAGRQRMRADGTLRPEKPPRGLILSTGEDIPRGQSVRARLLLLEIGPGDVNVGKLTSCQHDAAAGQYARALAGFIQWVAKRYDSIKAGLPDQVAKLRSQALTGKHARTPEILANLAVGWRYFLTFATEVGALSGEEADRLYKCGWDALGEAAQAQAGPQEDAEPTGKFMRLLEAALASGRAHVAGEGGGAPDDRPEAWGWRPNDSGHESQGRRIGWIKDRDLYLEPEAAFAEAQELANKQGDSLAITSRTLWQRMKEKELLAAWDENRKRLKVRRVLEGRQREVIAIAGGYLSHSPTGQTVHSGQKATETAEEIDGSDGRSDGRLDGSPAQPSRETVQKKGHSAANGRNGRSENRADEPVHESPADRTRDGRDDRDSQFRPDSDSPENGEEVLVWTA